MEEKKEKILFSDVEVKKKKRKVFDWSRKWSQVDVVNMVGMVGVHVVCLFAPFTFNWGAFVVAVVLYVMTGLFGITLCYHRYLTHKSFKLSKWLEYFFAYCAVHALQGRPMDWVSTHRNHHKFTDSDKDPHSPIEGFWYSHINWIFDADYVNQKCGEANNVKDLERQAYYRFLQSTYLAHPMALGVLLYIYGGFPYFVWGMGVRLTWVYHITFLVNSACHIWGYQTWNTGDLSKNNWFVALVTFGEGWHNNHHAFEFSARHGLEWWQIDMTYYVVKMIELIGLATDVKVPLEIQKQRMTLNVGTEGQKQETSLRNGSKKDVSK